MTVAAAKVIDEFKKLEPGEQRSVWNELARTVMASDYGPLSDEELTAIADQTFVLLDKEEEADGKTR